jgi:Cu/Ag efflux protein CusF
MPLQSQSAWLHLETWKRTRAHTPWRLASIASLCVFLGCAAAYTPPPLTTQHPAHPEAPTTPAPPPSTTLAYGPSDLPAPQPAVSLAHRERGQGTPHGTHGAHGSAPAPSSAVVGEGTVITVVPDKSQLVVDHKAIPGVMGAMTMGYTVTPPSLLDQLKAGDTIRFTMDPQQHVIITIEKLHE